MQSHFLDACGNLTVPRPPLQGLRRRRRRRFLWWSSVSLPPNDPARVSTALRVSCALPGDRGRSRGRMEEPIRARKKDNVWSIDNDLAAAAEEKARKEKYRRRRGRMRSPGRRGSGARVLVSGSMLMEVETVLQTQEPVIKPSWDTFASSVSGIWKGVAAVFSPFTAEMEPIGIGKHDENLYDWYTRSLIEKVYEDSLSSYIRRKTNWVALNPFGETRKHRADDKTEAKDGSSQREAADVTDKSYDLPSYESFDLSKSEYLAEDVMGMEPGLVFFEDGSYSKGPVDIPVGDFDESNYILSPTFQFEQCLVKGCHKRLRVVHTIQFSEGGSDVQIMRVAVYEEEWVSPANLDVGDDLQFDLKPFSQRKRSRPSELTGSWKVFEVSATPIFSEEPTAEGGLPFVYLCTETLKKRSLPESSVFFGEEEARDMQDVTVLWLPGGVTAYVDVNKDGILTIGIGWYLDEGVNLVVERDHGMDGKLKEVRWKTEVKRRWEETANL